MSTTPTSPICILYQCFLCPTASTTREMLTKASCFIRILCPGLLVFENIYCLQHKHRQLRITALAFERSTRAVYQTPLLIRVSQLLVQTLLHRQRVLFDHQSSTASISESYPASHTMILRDQTAVLPNAVLTGPLATSC